MGMERAHILVVDDDDRLRDLLKNYLSDNNFRVTTADNVRAARSKMENIEFDLIVLDRMMPGETGSEFAASIRLNNDIPILMLTAMTETNDRIFGLEVGVDDYLTKPFEPRELLLRINSILRRVPHEISDIDMTQVQFGRYKFDLQREELSYENNKVGLTSAESRLLRILVEKPGAIFSRKYLMNIVAPGGAERTVDVQVNRLRQKIEADAKLPRYLQTVRGKGYIFWPD
ncbi:MAG: response regulator transcription factor [Pseudomonadota bacterium]|nr:response regulator transcription factor [Pseudomonadota bacterium]